MPHMAHPLVTQLRFTRSEFKRALAGISDPDAQKRLIPMNSISWIIGHLAWQEQRYWLQRLQGKTPLPMLDEKFCSGCPGNTPPLDEMWAAWRAIVDEAEPFLDALTEDDLLREHTFTFGDGSTWTTSAGNLMQRVIYHYWYHTGEIIAIRQMMGHTQLPEFVGDVDTEAPYLPR
jgi:uncharacterized damage-inducible protein DinB